MSLLTSICLILSLLSLSLSVSLVSVPLCNLTLPLLTHLLSCYLIPPRIMRAFLIEEQKIVKKVMKAQAKK
jgi:hypothetical protein